MPSVKHPRLVVVPGPGRASFSQGLGAENVYDALITHLHSTVEAHMASSIGISHSLRKSHGGRVDGASVEDFVSAAVALYPVEPLSVGFSSQTIPNTGVPDWGVFDSASVAGAFTDAGVFKGLAVILDSSPDEVTLGGVVYPADRGVLALYQEDAAGVTALKASLSLGSSILGVPVAPFNEALVEIGQPDYVASGVGLDRISLKARLPYLREYSGHTDPGTGVPWYEAFGSNFYKYQLARYAISVPVPPQEFLGKWYVVHWREDYVRALSDIEPPVWGAFAGHIYSGLPDEALPSDASKAIQRGAVYCKQAPGVVPSFSVSTLDLVAAQYVQLSGVFYIGGLANTGANPQFSCTFECPNLLDSPYYTSKAVYPTSTEDPLSIDFTELREGTYGVGFTEMSPAAGGAEYSVANPPLDGDVAKFTNLNVLPGGLAEGSATEYDGGQVKAFLRRPHVDEVKATLPLRFHCNTYQQTGPDTASTPTKEMFVDERFRYKPDVAEAAGSWGDAGVEPSVANKYDSSLVLQAASVTNHLQVANGLIWPQINYQEASRRPQAGVVVCPDYSAVLATDLANTPCSRVYLRAFDVGRPLGFGRFKIVGLAPERFLTSSVADFVAAHPGGVAIQLIVPDLDLGTGTMCVFDLGRPGPSLDPLWGCLTGLEVLPDEDAVIVSYNLGGYTTFENIAGEHPLFMRIYYLQPLATPLGVNARIRSIEWLPPVL